MLLGIGLSAGRLYCLLATESKTAVCLLNASKVALLTFSESSRFIFASGSGCPGALTALTEPPLRPYVADRTFNPEVSKRALRERSVW